MNVLHTTFVSSISTPLYLESAASRMRLARSEFDVKLRDR